MPFSAAPKNLILAEAGEAQASNQRLEPAVDDTSREVWGCSRFAHVLKRLKRTSRGDVKCVAAEMNSVVVLWDECESGPRPNRPVQDQGNRRLQPLDRAMMSLFLN